QVIVNKALTSRQKKMSLTKQGNRSKDGKVFYGTSPASMFEGRPAARSAPNSDAGAAGVARFNKKGNKVTNARHVLRKCRCKSRFCPDCGLSMGIRLRQRLLESASAFKKPLFLTLSIDRRGTTTGKGFMSASDSYDLVTQKKYIWRLMRAAGISQWMWVLEFQSKTGEGWPHWHMIIDVSKYPGGRLPKAVLKKLWGLWRDKWGIGGLDIQRVELKDRHHTICYITKYVTKQPSRGWPRWALQRNCIRLIGSSRSIGLLVSTEMRETTKKKVNPEEPEKDKKERRPIYKRVASCGLSTTILREAIDSEGEVSYCYLGELPGRLKDIEKLSKEEGSPVKIEQKEVEEFGYTWTNFEIRGPCLDLEKVEKWLDGCGYLESVEWDYVMKQDEILGQWENL
ncbi:MAG: hypothetical protein K8S55_06635, partial [Phycisphaerae bacterium]|nr:hypothetical protein [Phycisphaerae bacterium]